MRHVLKRGTIVISVAALGAALVFAGCSKKDASTSTTTGTGTSSTAAGTTDASGQSATGTPTTRPGTSADTSSNKVVTIGGKTEAEWKAALPALEQAAKTSPANTQALQDLAVAQYQLKDYTAAAATYQKMLKLKNDPMTHNNYANVLRDSGQADAALAQYDLAIKGDPMLTIAYVNKAGLLAATNRKAEAIKALVAGLAKVSTADQDRLNALKKQLGG